MSEGWFCFQRGNELRRPDSFQSPELDSLFLENPSVLLSAAWCISCRDRRLIYFWGDRTQFSAVSDIPGRLGYCVRKFRPFFDQFNAGSGVLLADDIFQAALSDPIKYVGSREIGPGVITEIYAGKGFLFFYQLRAVPAEVKSDLSVRTYLLDRSERGHEFCRQAEHFFERVPKEILRISIGAEKLLYQFFGPNCYDIFSEPTVPFAWPWQKCVEVRNNGAHPKQNSHNFISDGCSKFFFGDAAYT